MGVQTVGKNRRNKLALLGETARGSRQRKFLFDLFLSKCAEGKALRNLLKSGGKPAASGQ